MLVKRFKTWVARRVTTVFVFSYAIIVGTSAPILLGRCVSSGQGCGSCGGLCAVGLGVLPLVLFITLKSRIKHAGQRLSLETRKTAGRDCTQ